jgi:hypothetical protein
MRYVSAFAPQSRSRHGWSRILLLAALCALLGIAQGLAQAPVAENPQAPAASAPTEVAEFLATLSTPSGSPSGAADLLPPSPEFRQSSTGCTSDSQCPRGKMCCRACAFPGCTLMACLTPMDGHCPLIP